MRVLRNLSSVELLNESTGTNGIFNDMEVQRKRLIQDDAFKRLNGIEWLAEHRALFCSELSHSDK